jgi:hypothetical protein
MRPPSHLSANSVVDRIRRGWGATPPLAMALMWMLAGQVLALAGSPKLTILITLPAAIEVQKDLPIEAPDTLTKSFVKSCHSYMQLKSTYLPDAEYPNLLIFGKANGEIPDVRHMWTA